MASTGRGHHLPSSSPAQRTADCTHRDLAKPDSQSQNCVAGEQGPLFPLPQVRQAHPHPTKAPLSGQLWSWGEACARSPPSRRPAPLPTEGRSGGFLRGLRAPSHAGQRHGRVLSSELGRPRDLLRGPHQCLGRGAHSPPKSCGPGPLPAEGRLDRPARPAGEGQVPPGLELRTRHGGLGGRAWGTRGGGAQLAPLSRVRPAPPLEDGLGLFSKARLALSCCPQFRGGRRLRSERDIQRLQSGA